jgi:hypothetical protein
MDAVDVQFGGGAEDGAVEGAGSGAPEREHDRAYGVHRVHYPFVGTGSDPRPFYLLNWLG